MIDEIVYSNILKNERCTMQTLSARPRNYKIIPVEVFLNLSELEKQNIRRVKILAPDMDDNDFGYMQVYYKHPIYEIEVD
ncbi:MAG: hypothetical protein WCI11_17055 [Candidatus Methylumidiphilus sp.]